MNIYFCVRHTLVICHLLCIIALIIIHLIFTLVDSFVIFCAIASAANDSHNGTVVNGPVGERATLRVGPVAQW